MVISDLWCHYYTCFGAPQTTPIYDNKLNQQTLSMFWVLHWPPISHLSPSPWKSERVAQLCPILCDPMDYSLPGSSVHGILQARILEWVVISFSRGSFQPRNRTQVSCTAGRFFTLWATRETPPSPWVSLFPETHNIEIKPINNPTITSEWSSEKNTHMSLILNHKLEMIKLSESLISLACWKLRQVRLLGAS